MTLEEQLEQLERRVARLELRETVLRSTENRRVLRALARHFVTVTPAELERDTCLGSGTIARALFALRNAGYVDLVTVSATGTGYWQATVDGQDAFAEIR